jgi:GT2 family glycosyltransferase
MAGKKLDQYTDEKVLDTSKIKVENGEAKVDIATLRQECNVFFATPCYGGLLTDQYFLSMFRATQELIKHGINFRITTLRNESLITRGRNILTAMFLDSGASHLFFIDADIEFQADSIVRMLAMDKDIIAGAYPKKSLPVQYAINFKYTDPVAKTVRMENGAVEVMDASTGFFCIKRKVFDEMMIAYPELSYKNDSNIDPKLQKYCYALFDTIIDEDDHGDRRYLSEDYTFCRRWQKLGGEIWLDPNTQLNHVGSYTFEGDLNQVLNKPK